MAYSVTPLSGIDLVSLVQTNPNSANVQIPSVGPLGLQVFGSDGKLYVCAQANGAIPANTTACTVNPTTFLATATGGAFTSTTVALVAGDVAWFSEASV